MVTKLIQEQLHYSSTGKDRLPKIFSGDDIKAIFLTIRDSQDYLKTIWGDWMKTRDSTVISLMLAMGLRPREACWLRFDDFDLNNMTLRIRAENNKVKKERVVPIPDTVIPFITAYLSFNRSRFWRGSPWMFPSLENERMSVETIKGRFRKTLKQAGLWKIDYIDKAGRPRPSLHLYSCRHTALTRLFNASGGDLYMTANQAGHASVTSTLKYLHLDDGYREKQRKTLNKMFEYVECRK